MDRALWISWYDLPDSRARRLSFVGARHVHAGDGEAPGRAVRRALQVRRGAGRGARAAGGFPTRRTPSCGTGNGYIMIVGAEDAHAFGRPTPRKLHAGAVEGRSEDAGAARKGERVNIMTDEARADGLDAKKREAKAALSPCIQLGTFQAGTADGDEDEMLEWYAQCRMPNMTRLPGCVGVRKIVSVSGWAKHGVLYEFVSLAERNKHFPDPREGPPAGRGVYRPAGAHAARTRRDRRTWRSGLRSRCRIPPTAL